MCSFTALIPSENLTCPVPRIWRCNCHLVSSKNSCSVPNHILISLAFGMGQTHVEFNPTKVPCPNPHSLTFGIWNRNTANRLYFLRKGVCHHLVSNCVWLRQVDATYPSFRDFRLSGRICSAVLLPWHSRTGKGSCGHITSLPAICKLDDVCILFKSLASSCSDVVDILRLHQWMNQNIVFAVTHHSPSKVSDQRCLLCHYNWVPLLCFFVSVGLGDLQ